MKKRVNKILPFLISVIAGIVIVSFFYGKVLFSPDDYMFSISGDGMKNYFTYAYHIKHDTSFIHHEGMNYPYGENYLYTDCHPAIANSVKWLGSYFPFWIDHSVGLINMLMILSVILTFLVIYRLLLELKVHHWTSVVFSIGITLLAPQIFRLSGHFALSYSVAIPLSWLILLICLRKRNKWYYLIFFGNLLFWMLIHAYLGMVILSFVFSILIIKFVSYEKSKKKVSAYLWLLISIIAPVIIFYSYAMLTDTHSFRTNNPSGFFLYNAEFDDIFLPHEKPFRPVLDKLTGGAIDQEWEARGYVGMASTLLLLALVLTAMASIFIKSSRRFLFRVFNNRLLNISLLAAFVVLLFAMAFPFKQFPWLLEIMPVFKQFRATGRFVWPFYFAFSVFAAYTYQQILVSTKPGLKGRIAGSVVMLLIMAVYLIEGYHYHEKTARNISHSNNFFKPALLPEDFHKALKLIRADDYQAIISLPFYYQGSESYSRPRNEEAVRNSLLFSYHSGIPNICANLTRTSVEESKRIVQIVTPNYYSKKIINDFSSDKPLLIIKSGIQLSHYEQDLLSKGEKIFESESFELYKIDFEALFKDRTKKAIKEFLDQEEDLFVKTPFLVSDEEAFLYYDGFEDNLSDTSFRGEGAFRSVKKGKNVFAEFPPYTFEEGKAYHLSLWMYNAVPDALNLWFRLIVEEYDISQDKWYTTTFFPEQAEVVTDSWSMTEGIFRIRDAKNPVYIVSKGKDNSKASLYADDLMIKEYGMDIYKVDRKDSTLFNNNHKIALTGTTLLE